MRVLTLRQKIRRDYKGNLSAFARDIGEWKRTVERWEAADCIWLEDANGRGDVYGRKTFTSVVD